MNDNIYTRYFGEYTSKLYEESVNKTNYNTEFTEKINAKQELKKDHKLFNLINLIFMPLMVIAAVLSIFALVLSIINFKILLSLVCIILFIGLFFGIKALRRESKRVKKDFLEAENAITNYQGKMFQ